MLDRKIYCSWVGNNNQHMNDNRKRGLESLRENSEVEVVLVTNENLHEFLVPEGPLHQGFQYLSDVHKADYIRTYAMHFHGGGYTDIKPCNYSWRPYFDQLENSYAFGIGAKEDEGPLSTPLSIRDRYGHRWPDMISFDMFIFKPRSEFTYIWYQEMLRRLDRDLHKLIEHPARDSREASDTFITQYPLDWGWNIQIFHPVCVHYTDKVLKTMPYPNRQDYR